VSQISAQSGDEPISLDIGGEIIDNFANISYSLVFDNQNSDEDLSVIYDMREPAPLYLSNVSADMGDEMYWGKVYPISQAQQIYNESVAANKSAVLVTSLNDIYRFEVNIKAGNILNLKAYFEGYITRNLGTYNLILFDPVNSVYTLDFSVDLKIVSSFSSVISSRFEGLSGYSKSSITNGVQLTFSASNHLLSSMLSTRYSLNTLSVGGQLLTYTNGTDSFFAYLFAPEIDDIADREIREYLFIIDVSGSMSGTPLEQAKEAFNSMIETLGGSDLFNVVAFSSSSRLMWTEADVASVSNKDNAIDWVNDLSAGGGTNINDALVDGFSTFSGTTTAKAVVFLSDGAPTSGETNTDQILTNTALANIHGAPIFSVAFGDNTEEGLMGSLAFESNGLFTKILPGDQAVHKLEMFYEIFEIPVALGVQMTYQNAQGIQPNPNVVIGAIFNGSEIITTGLFTGELQITTKVVYSTGDVSYTNTASSASTDNPYVELIWAHNTINKLLLQSIINPENQDIKAEIVTIAVNYGIVVPNFTGLTIVLEEKAEDDVTETTTEATTGPPNYDAGNINNPGSAQTVTDGVRAGVNPEEQKSDADDAGMAPISFFAIFSAFLIMFSIVKFRKKV
jgi:hypothetical protein